MWKEKIAGILHYFLEKKDIESMDPWNLYTGSADFSERSRSWQQLFGWTDTGEKIQGLTIRSFALNWRGLGQLIVLEPGVYTLSAFVESEGLIYFNGRPHNSFEDGDAVINIHSARIGVIPEMKRISYTFEVVSGGVAYPRFESSENGLTKIAGLMLNKGPIALPWNYAKEDLEDRFADIESQIVGGGFLNLRLQSLYWRGA